jgi:hypothetical protein
MSKNKRRITIELTERDQENLKIIQGSTGDFTVIAAIRYALREAARSCQGKDAQKE